MSRAGVSADHAERCLGHVIGGVRGVYDRHEFADEKRAAFEALARPLKLKANGEPATSRFRFPTRSSRTSSHR